MAGATHRPLRPAARATAGRLARAQLVLSRARGFWGRRAHAARTPTTNTRKDRTPTDFLGVSHPVNELRIQIQPPRRRGRQETGRGFSPFIPLAILASWRPKCSFLPQIRSVTARRPLFRVDHVGHTRIVVVKGQEIRSSRPSRAPARATTKARQSQSRLDTETDRRQATRRESNLVGRVSFLANRHPAVPSSPRRDSDSRASASSVIGARNRYRYRHFGPSKAECESPTVDFWLLPGR